MKIVSRQWLVVSETLKRFALFSLLAILPLAITSLVEAQDATKFHRIGYLTMRSDTSEKIRISAFLQALRDLGYVEGKNLVFELRRAAPEKSDRLRDLAAELIRMKVDLIVASSGDAAHVAKAATATIPVVFTVSADPVGTGLVQSLAHPGGNVTGLSDLHSVLVTKRFELLKEVVPSATRVGFLWNSASSSGPLQLKDLQTSAPAFGVTVLSFPVKGADGFDRVFVAMGKQLPNVLLVQGNPLLGASYRKRIFEFTVKNRLASIYTTRENVDAGGLMSYGTNFDNLWRRAAVYVDKILKGAKPADLPVEQPTKFEFVINLKTAKQIGLTIPPNVLARADRVIR
jgi:putative ABC transport system substrate-binding protein